MSDDFWESAAQRDPLWAVLSDPSKRGRRWDLADFFETGRREVSLLMYQLQQLGQTRQGRALDFGCGVGRLSQALGNHFREVVGVDVSPTMVRLAEQLNQYPTTVNYVVNQEPSLSLFREGEFDFIYSDIVLQHLEPAVSQGFIKEFLRILSSGGVAVFQLSSHPRTAAEIPVPPVHMPDGAYRAKIEVLRLAPTLRSADTTVAVVQVENISAYTWDQRSHGVIRVGNHWRDRAGAMLIQDDGREAIPTIVMPRSPFEVTLSVRSPNESGEFECEFDLVHEGVSWFRDRGSSTPRMTIRVGTPSDSDRTNTIQRREYTPVLSNTHEFYAALPTTDTVVSDFPMYGVPRQTVIELMASHNAELFHVETDERSGPEWVGFRYFVRKR